MLHIFKILYIFYAKKYIHHLTYIPAILRLLHNTAQTIYGVTVLHIVMQHMSYVFDTSDLGLLYKSMLHEAVFPFTSRSVSGHRP